MELQGGGSSTFGAQNNNGLAGGNRNINDSSGKKNEIRGPPKGLKIIEVIGNGTFGVVYKAELNGVEVAVKRVFQDRKYKNREKEIISTLNHQNVVKCKEDFETKGEK